MSFRRELLLLLLLLLLSAPPRLAGLDVLPPGLHHDEAYEGIDGARILAGARPVFLQENFGREPLYAYVVAPLIAVFGQTSTAVRSTSAIFGLLGIAAAWFWGRTLFNPRTALLIAGFTAASYWQLHESRLGMRPIAITPWLALASAGVWLGARDGRRWGWLLAGVSLGIALLTYLPARVFPAVLLAEAAFGCWARFGRSAWRKAATSAVAGSAVVVLLALAVSAPMWLYFRANPEDLSARSSVVSVFASPEGQANPALAFTQNVGLDLGMFLWRGDDTVRHNLPYRPVFDPLVGACFLLGAALTFRQIRRAEYATLWAWLPIMMLPGVLSDSAPHFLRTIGIMPALFALPAVGLLAGADWLGRRAPVLKAVPLGAMLGAGVLTLSQLWTWYDYRFRLPQDPDIDRLFDARLARLAAVAGNPPKDLDVQLPTPGWSHPTIRFLRPRSFAAPQPTVPDGRRVGNVMEYLGYTAAPSDTGQAIELSLYFRALREMNASYIVSVRVLDEYNRVWGQSVLPPGRGTLPTDTWAPREVVQDRRTLDIPEGTPSGDYTLEISVLQPDRNRPLPIELNGRQTTNALRLPGFHIPARDGR